MDPFGAGVDPGGWRRLEKVGARLWIARIMVTWGLISGAMALVKGPISFYVLRFLLGAAEAGFFPGIILYLSYWFPARQRAGVTALFMAAAPVSTALGSPVSAALLQMGGVLGLAGWQWMFILEAVPALILGVVTFFFMTDRPAHAYNAAYIAAKTGATIYASEETCAAMAPTSSAW